MRILQKPSLDFEVQAGFPAIRVAGVDEVGRGCLAGPVVAAAVILPPQVDREEHPWLNLVTDSKLLSEPVREELAPEIQRWVSGYAIGEASVEEIDRINIFHASHLAMERAVAGLGAKPSHILVDGKFAPKAWLGFSTTIIKGDSRSLSIACAAILAKVYRDHLMKHLDALIPGYGMAKHKGYSTPEHNEGLRRLGPTDHHRKSFAPVREAMGQLGLGLE